jgi:putative membrane protein
MRSVLVVVLASLMALLWAAWPAGPGWAHSGEPLAPHDLWSAWSRDSLIWLTLLVAALLYLRGAAAVRRRAGPGRGLSNRQVLCFSAGWLALAAALLSPLEALALSLFSAHMVQHFLLVLVAPPLILLGAPPSLAGWALPEGWRGPAARGWNRLPGLKQALGLAARPAPAWVLHAAALVVWHAPPLYQAALTSELMHLLEHASFFATALFFWRVALESGRRAGLNHALGMLYVFSMAMFTGLLGALITFSRQPWYPHYASLTQTWGLTPLEDQQLAGVIMWVPANFIYLAVFLWLLSDWFRQFEKRERRSVPLRPAAGERSLEEG